MRNNIDDNTITNLVFLFIFSVWILAINHIILWSVAETRKQTTETNKIVKEIQRHIAENK